VIPVRQLSESQEEFLGVFQDVRARRLAGKHLQISDLRRTLSLEMWCLKFFYRN
jgi:hypothetical protein